jgi:peroxiredoxin
MAQLRQDYQKFVDRNSEIIAVGPEDPKSFTEWWHEHHIQFIGIPDPSHDIAKLYYQQVKWLKGGRMPALVVIDKEGRVRLKHYADSPGDIPSDDTLLSLLDELNKTNGE